MECSHTFIISASQRYTVRLCHHDTRFEKMCRASLTKYWTTSLIGPTLPLPCPRS